ncbi:MAG: dephospho-CoA kinase [Actinomycetota bacterium]|nr:dephospho-CoA kinase [Actinomycetota bacterium]
MRVGLTGGVGSGKSTVAALLSQRGAFVIDADAISREVVEPGTPGFNSVVARFGDGVVGPDGSLDRPALAQIVFADDEQRAELNAIVHPLVGQRVAEIEAAAVEGSVTVYDVPLLVESNMAAGFDFVVVVLATVDTRLSRLAGRGMAEADARNRMAAQAGDDQRREIADEVIDNNGDLDALTVQVDRIWKRVQAGGRTVGQCV